ncbi:MAG: hypothetical protein JRG69_06270 [Deltaproteobacteria bacterium]|nr:hypothetical protein [Deltaproteobacteria bacterium]
MTNSTITCGAFSYNTTTNEVAGPAAYMAERGSARLERIMSGNDVVFNMGCTRSPSVEMAVLVSLQTDFAGWKGTRQSLAGLR